MDVKKRMQLWKLIKARGRLRLAKLNDELKMCSELLSLYKQMQLHLLRQLQLLKKKQLMLLVVKISLLTRKPRLYEKKRKKTFWERDCQINDEEFFTNNFRMSRKSFNLLCSLLPNLARSDTTFRQAIPLDKRVAIALYTLGSSESYRVIAEKFGVGSSTVYNVVLNFCSEVWKVLAPMYLNQFPLSTNVIDDLVNGFKTLGFPQCLGALGTCHIEIITPAQNDSDYYNSNGWHSVILLALVDARSRFIYVESGHPGRLNGGQIFQTSSLKSQLDQCVLLKKLKKKISDVEVPVVIVGNSEFALSSIVMTPYPSNITRNKEQETFDSTLSKCHKVSENAFRQLRARFRRLGDGLSNIVTKANTIITACCVLNNFLSDNNEEVKEEWLQALSIVELKRPSPKQTVRMQQCNNSAEEIRNAITKYLNIFI